MGWSIGFDTTWKRDIGYGVPATCDHPQCNKKIHRGLSYVCGGEPFGGEEGCGLFFCPAHMKFGEQHQVCIRCAQGRELPFTPKPDHPEWVAWKLTDPSWADWRAEHPEEVERMRASLEPSPPPSPSHERAA